MHKFIVADMTSIRLMSYNMLDSSDRVHKPALKSPHTKTQTNIHRRYSGVSIVWSFVGLKSMDKPQYSVSS